MSITVGNFTFHKTSIDGVFKIDVKKFGDNRGYFVETYKKPDFDKAGLVFDFIQDNQSASNEFCLRVLSLKVKTS